MKLTSRDSAGLWLCQQCAYKSSTRCLRSALFGCYFFFLIYCRSEFKWNGCGLLPVVLWKTEEVASHFLRETGVFRVFFRSAGSCFMTYCTGEVPSSKLHCLAVRPLWQYHVVEQRSFSLNFKILYFSETLLWWDVWKLWEVTQRGIGSARLWQSFLINWRHVRKGEGAARKCSWDISVPVWHKSFFPENIEAKYVYHSYL